MSAPVWLVERARSGLGWSVSAAVPVRGTGTVAFVKGLDAAIAAVTADIVGWTLKSI